MATEQNAIPKRLGMISPDNHTEEIHAFYSSLYKTEVEDSPDESRVSLIRRLRQQIISNSTQNLILDLGAGRQILERDYAQQTLKKEQPLNCHFFTVDLADIDERQLLAPSFLCTHFKADGSNLPFSDGKFDVAISNMALDFMGPQAVDEVHRVLVSNGHAFFNFHHPLLIPPDIDNLVAKAYRKIAHKTKYQGTISEQSIRRLKVLLHHKYLKDHNILFQSTDQIVSTLSSHGFSIDRVLEASASYEKWWEVDAIKIRR